MNDVTWYDKDAPDRELSENFSLSEFCCRCDYEDCATTMVSKRLVNSLQMYRRIKGKAVHLTSAHRCQRHNEDVGGKADSMHTRGEAADIAADPLQHWIAERATLKKLFDVVIYYEDHKFFHVHNEGMEWRRKGKAQ